MSCIETVASNAAYQQILLKIFIRFRRVRKISKVIFSFVMSVRTSVHSSIRMEHLGSY